jgi:hypothetical protein
MPMTAGAAAVSARMKIRTNASGGSSGETRVGPVSHCRSTGIPGNRHTTASGRVGEMTSTYKGDLVGTVAMAGAATVTTTAVCSFTALMHAHQVLCF